MRTEECGSADFHSLIAQEKFRDAVASVMGQNPTGLSRTRDLLIRFYQLNVSQQKALIEWSEAPVEKLAVTDQRWYLEEIARHEFAHIVVGKVCGFRTGAVTLVLNSPDGSHQGTSEIFLCRGTSSIDEVVDYLERRMMVLLAGAIAEPANADLRRTDAYTLVRNDGPSSDFQKVLELLRIYMNIRKVASEPISETLLRSMILRTSAVVEENYEVIDALAKRFADGISFYGQRIGWTESDIDQQPEVKKIMPR
jgi:hypothetical protein